MQIRRLDVDPVEAEAVEAVVELPEPALVSVAELTCAAAREPHERAPAAGLGHRDDEAADGGEAALEQRILDQHRYELDPAGQRPLPCPELELIQREQGREEALRLLFARCLELAPRLEPQVWRQTG